MMAGAVSLSLADALVPAAMATRASGTLVHSGALLGGLVLGAGRWGADVLRSAATIHTSASFRNGGSTEGQPSPNGPTAATGPHPGPPSLMRSSSPAPSRAAVTEEPSLGEPKTSTGKPPEESDAIADRPTPPIYPYGNLRDNTTGRESASWSQKNL